MKTIIAGSRTIQSYAPVLEAIRRSGMVITEVVSGKATGVDLMGERYAGEQDIPVKPFPPDWAKHGKKAGILRNLEMLDYADQVIVVWDGTSTGSQHTCKEGLRRGMPVFLQKVDVIVKANQPTEYNLVD